MVGRRQGGGSGGSYVGPTDEVAAPVLKVLEPRMLDHFIGEIDVQSVFEQGEAGVNRAIVPSEFLV